MLDTPNSTLKCRECLCLAVSEEDTLLLEPIKPSTALLSRRTNRVRVLIPRPVSKPAVSTTKTRHAKAFMRAMSMSLTLQSTCHPLSQESWPLRDKAQSGALSPPRSCQQRPGYTLNNPTSSLARQLSNQKLGAPQRPASPLDRPYWRLETLDGWFIGMSTNRGAKPDNDRYLIILIDLFQQRISRVPCWLARRDVNQSRSKARH